MIKPINKLPIIIAAFLVLANIIVLAGVSANRSGEPVASLKLTERELSLPRYRSSSKENSGVALKLNWNLAPTRSYDSKYSRYNLGNYGTPIWLSEQKLHDLGIDIVNIKTKLQESKIRYQKIKSADVIIVLEYNGETFQKILNNAEEDIKHYRNAAKNSPNDEDLKDKLKSNEESLTELKTQESRLIAIDAGLDLETLKQTYNDSSKYLMLRGEVKLYWSNKELKAHIKQLFNASVHVPLPYSKVFGGIDLKKQNTEEKIGYEVELLVGERLEVWVGGVLL